ncbi:MAG: hypothetical protein ACI35O_14010, partial [Bacillaceae bacterium]
FRSLSTFEEVLASQQNKSNLIAPTKDEADYLYVIQNSNDILSVSQQIVTLAQNSSHPSNHSEIKEI